MHIAVITEYNPFHSGHEYQLAEIRRAFPDACITAIMGGIFSQRGAPYITTPYVRANAAVNCGADLVLELPFPFSCAPAKIFARAGVEIAAKIGADMLAFGSECGNVEALKTTLDHLDGDEIKKEIKKIGDKTLSKMQLYSIAYKNLYGKECSDKPNDILGVEYLRAIKNGKYKLTPYTIKRVGDFKSGEGGFASATSIRRSVGIDGICALTSAVPKKAESIFRDAYEKGLFGADIEKLSSAILLKLASASSDTAFSSGGLLSHIKKAASTATSIANLMENTSTKRYTDAEISRCILFSLLDVKTTDLDSPIYYTKLFGATKKGCEILNGISDIEIITKPSATKKISQNAKAQYEKSLLAERAFALCFDGCYEHTKQTPVII